MKKIILTSCILFTVVAFSQEIRFGAKAGLNVSSLRGNYPKDVDETKSRIGFHIGGFAEYEIDDKFSLQPELLISTQGGSFEVRNDYYDSSMGNYYESFTQTPKLTYLNLPIMLKYKVLEKLSIEFGPQIGYLIGAKSKWEYVDSTNPNENETIEVDMLKDGTYTFGGTTVQIKPKTNRLDFGLNIGSSYDLTEQLFVQARYNLGLSAFDKNSTNGTSTNSWDLKNSVIQVSAGYRF